MTLTAVPLRPELAVAPLDNLQEPAPTTTETISSAFRLENEVAAIIDYYNRPEFEPEEGFDIADRAESSDIFRNYFRSFIGVQSNAAFDAVETRILEELADRRTLAAAGWSGIIAGVLAGTLSPTILFPIAGPGRGAKAIASAFGYATVGAGIQEGILYAEQEARSVTEVAFGVGTATVLGGLLGTAAVYLRRAQFNRITTEMADNPGGLTVMEGAPIGSRGKAVPPQPVNVARSAFNDAKGDFKAAIRLVGSNEAAVKVLRRAERLLDERTPAVRPFTVEGSKDGAKSDNFFATIERPEKGKATIIINRLVDDENAPNGVSLGEEVSRVDTIGKGAAALAKRSVMEAETAFIKGESQSLDIRTKALDDAEEELAPASGAAGAAAKDPLGQFNPETGEFQDVSGIKYAFWLGRQLAKLSPVLRAASSKFFPRMRSIARQIDDAGVGFADNVAGVATARGGTIRNNVMTWNGFLYKALQQTDELYAKYMLGKVVAFGAERAILKSNLSRLGLGGSDRKMSRPEFNEQVTRVMWLKEPDHTIPEVNEAAHLWRTEVYDRLLKEATQVPGGAGGKPMIDPKWLEPDPITGQTRQVVGDESYVNRIYLENVIKSNRGEWINILTKHNLAKMEAKFQQKLTKLFESNKRLTQEAEDLELDKAAVKEVKDELLEELKALETGSDVIQSDHVDLLRALAREARQAGDDTRADELLFDAREHERVTDVTEFRAERGAIRKRLRTLSQSAGRVSERRREKLQKVEKLEADSVKALERVVRAAEIADRELAKVSDEKLDGVIKTLRVRFSDEARLFDKSEDELVDLVKDELRAVREAETTSFPEPVKIKVSKVQVEEVKRLFPELAEELGLRVGVQKLDGPAARRLAVEIEKLELAGDLTPARRRSLGGFARKIQDKLGELRDPDLSEASAVASGVDQIAARQGVRGERMSSISEKLEDVQIVDRDRARLFIQATREDALRRLNGVNSRRAVRQEKLRVDAEQLDPARVKRHSAFLREKAILATDEFLESMRLRGADDVDLDARTADFSAFARQRVIEMTDRIVGNPSHRIVGLDTLTTHRGPELARVLDIPSEKIDRFLDLDIEHNGRAYVRTMSADVELHNRLGDANGVQVFAQLKDDKDRLVTQLLEKHDRGAISATARDKQIAAVESEFENGMNDLSAIISRLKNLRGLPVDAEGYGYRAAKLALDLNTLRLMGNVVISSVPDIARPIMKFGLLRTFRDGWMPMIRSWGEFRVMARETHYAGTANDVLMASRAQGMFDIYDDIGRFSMFERGINIMANRMGNIALFNNWTSWQKQIVAGVVNGKLWDSLDHMATGSTRSISKSDAVEFLAQSGIDDSNWRLLWKQVEDGNVKRVNNVLLPNTADWKDAGAVKLYRQLLVKHLDDTIVTPGLERPLWMDKSPMLRVVAQFRSFAFASNTKMMVAGLQQHDMALLNGIALSLAMGSFGYYLWATSVGGNAQEEMLKFDMDKWADEAITRSGLLGVFGEAHRIAERIPALQNIVSFSGQRTTRRGGDTLVGAILGPSFDLAKTGSAVIMGLDAPTESTLHKMRLLQPYQNLFYTRRLLTQVEEATAEGLNLPRSRR